MAAGIHHCGNYKAEAIPKSFIGAWLVLLMGVSVYIRVHGADGYHFSNDEAMVFNVANGRTLKEVVHLSLYEVHPPLFYMLLHYWMAISTDPAFVRGFSLLFGILTILLYYRIGKFLSGEFTGLCAAALVAFSPGWIVQSYLLRQYATFIFFLSCAFYSYLVWQRNRRPASLLAYMGFACIACFMHFSGILAIFCIAAYEMGVLYLRMIGWKTALCWALVNLPPALITLSAYHFCEPTITNVKDYVDASGTDPVTHASYMAWKALLFYPLNVTFYLFSTPLIALLMLVLCPIIGRKNPELRPFLMLSGIVLALGTLLCATQAYSIVSARHDMWTFPFLTVTAAWTLSDLYVRYGRKTPWSLSFPQNAFMAILLLIIGWAMVDPSARFADLFEYQVPEKQWQALSRYVDTLGPSDLIVANRDDAILLQNTYPYLDEAASSTAVLMPLRHTHMLFGPVHRRYFKGNLLAEMLNDARARGLLEGITRLVFYQTQWALILDPDLTLCPASDKQVIAFPQSNPAPAFRSRLSSVNYATLTIVPASGFLNQIVFPQDTIHPCLRGKHDPFYVPPSKDR
jgi:hypothetical protein